MSIEATTWALNVPVGGNAKVVLLGLANHAHPDGTESYPALDTLAKYANCDRSTARRNVRKLVAEGWAIEDGHGPKGQTKYRLPIGRTGGSKMPPVAERDGVAPAPGGGGSSASEGVAPMPPEPSIEPSKEPSTRKTENAREDPRNRPPDDFPDELRPHAREVLRILRAIAADHPRAKAVWPREVGLAVMAFPRRPLVETAHELAGWAVDPPRPILDVARTYRTFLSKKRDLAAVERLAVDGSPASGPMAPVGNVHPLRRRGGSQADDIDAEVMRLRGHGSDLG